MAALRIFARHGVARSIANPVRSHDRTVAPVVAQIQHRWSSYKSSPMYTKPEDYTDYEITKDPNEWKYVESVLPYKVIPKPPTGDVDLPSGWKPVHASPKDNPYFIERTKNYMQPVYLNITFRGMKKVTEITNIQGDIWTLERDIKSYLEDHTKRKLASQIHEFAGIIKFKGDFVSRVKEWMNMKGF